jgi:hypothetical protein
VKTYDCVSGVSEVRGVVVVVVMEVVVLMVVVMAV